MNLYHMIIVDDEVVIRNGLARNIDWADIHIEVNGCFEDGQDALEYMQQNPVDIVLTDIKMYEMSGLELAAWAQKNRPDVQVVIISGFCEFDFAREAIRVGALDYLLKPLDLDEVIATLTRVCQRLDRQRSVPGAAAPDAPLPSHERLLKAILQGAQPGLSQTLAQWEQERRRCAPEQSQEAAVQLLNELYAQLDRVGVRLPPELQRPDAPGEPSDLDARMTAIGAFLADKKCLDETAVVENAKAYIAAHLSESFSVEDLSDYLYISSRHLRREFHRITGRGVAEYVIQQRMERAMELLKTTDARAAQIGKLVGYADSQYFQRSFKKYTGYSVREYRNMVRP